MKRIVLAEDHEVVRAGFRAILESDPTLEIVGEATTGQQALNLVLSLKPDLLIVDVMMPGLNGLEVTWQVKKRHPKTKVIVLSMYDSEPYVMEALLNGASAYILKSSGAGELQKAIAEVEAGRRYLGPPLSQRTIEQYIADSKEQPELHGPYATLSRREREVFQLTIEGRTSREVGQALSISPRTVEKHRTNLMSKLGVHSQAELIQFALRNQPGQKLPPHA